MTRIDVQVAVARGESATVVSSAQSNAGGDYRGRRFAECFRVHYPRVLAYGLRRLVDRAAAEDAAAETFLVAWRRFDDAPSDQLPWLLAIARNVIFNETRSVRRRDRLAARLAAERVVLGEQPAAGSNEGSDDLAANADTVRAALEQLGDRDREILLLSELNEPERWRAGGSDSALAPAGYFGAFCVAVIGVGTASRAPGPRGWRSGPCG